MKHSKKLISLILVLVMLVTMVPVGLFTASAETADYTVSSVAEWNSLAAQNLDFDGKTVALGGDINAENAALTTLSDTFKGSFDGQGYTISNATVAGSGLIANTLSGNATVQNFKLANVDLTSAGAAGMIAAAVTDGTVTVTKINIDADSSITGAGVTGGILGTVKLTAAASTVTVSHILMDAPVTTGDFNVGGLIGQDDSIKGGITIDTVVTKSIVTHSGATKGSGVIGLITGVNTQNAQVVSLSNLIVGGTQSGSTGHSSTANDTIFFFAHNGTINYENLFVLPGTSPYTMGISYWAAWMNGFQFGSGVREKLTINAIKSDGRTTPPKEISADEATTWMKLDEDGFLMGLVDPNCDHDWSDYSLVSEATKNDPKIEKRSCSKCGLEQTKESPALGWSVEEFLADYDNCTTVNITTATEWATLAAANKNFENKTVKLCANISGITVPLANSFAGSFLGGDFTISDSAVASSGLIANSLAGNVTVKDLKLANVDLTSTGAAGMIAASVADGTVLVQRITVDADSSITGAGVTGGLVGTVKLTAANSSLTVSHILMEAPVTTGDFNVGGLIGQDDSTQGTLTVDTVVTKSIVTHTGATKGSGVIGLITGVDTQNTQVVSLSNIIVGGTQSGSTGHTSTANDTVFFYAMNGTINYESLFVISGASRYMMGFSYWATWMNGFQFGSGVREKLTISAIKSDGRTTAPMELAADLEEMPLTLDAGGFLKKVGRPEKTPTLDLTNYDTTDTFTIKNFADWELISASGKDFAGKKILLDADLDAWNDKIPPLADTFKGSFDGQGHKIFNAMMTGSGVIANTIEAGSDITIENLVLEYVWINYQGGSAGLLAGTVRGTDKNITIRKINTIACSVVTTDYAGGLIGLLNATASSKAVTVEITQVSVSATVKATKAAMQAGGLLGNDSSKGASETSTVTINVSDSVVTCTVSASKSCGLIGQYGTSTANSTLNLNNLVIGGGTNYKVLYIDQGAVNYKNLYLLDTTGNLFAAYRFASTLNGITTNLVGDTANSTPRNSITEATLTAAKMQPPRQTSAKIAAAMVIKDESGFVKTVPDYLQVTAVQRSAEIKNNTYAIRFVAPSQLSLDEMSNVQMEVVATWKDALGVTQTMVFRTDNQDCVDDKGNPTSACTFYDFLSVYSAHGIAEKSIGAEQFGAKKIAGFTIWDVPVDATNMPEGITFAATMSYTNSLDQTVTSRTVTVTLDAQGNIQ